MEINDLDVTNSSQRETNELLQRYYHQEPEGLKIAVARLLNSELMGEDVPTNMIERYKMLNSSLSVRIDSQNAEVEHWRQECNRLLYTG